MALIQDNYKTLKEALNDVYRVDTLKTLAKHIGKNTPLRKAEIIDHITSIMFNDLRGIVSKMKPMAINALSEAVHNWDGVFEDQQFHAKYEASPFGSAGRSRGEIDILYLFFINNKIPENLFQRLKKFIPTPKEEKINYCEQPKEQDFTVRETAHAALINLNMLLTMVKEEKIKVSEKTGRATAATMKKISGGLCDGDFYDDDEIGHMQPFSWPLLLQGGGLAKTDGKLLKLTGAGNKALKKNLAEGIRNIWKKWEKTKIIDEYSRVTAVKGQKSAKGRTMTSPVRRRPEINAAMGFLEPGRWIEVNELARFMLSENYTFDMSNYDWKLYFSDPHYGHIDYSDTWDILHLRYILVYFFEYCATMGILDVAYKDPENARTAFRSCWGADDLSFLSHCDGLTYIRLNELGAYALGISSEYGTSDGREFEIKGSDIIHTGSGLPTPDHSLYLDKIAEQQDQRNWRISLTSLLDAVKTGETLREIIGFIKKISSEKMGKELETLFEDAAIRSTAVTEKGKVTLLECHSEIRKQILTDRKLSRLCMPAGDHYLVILPEKDEEFARVIETLGVIIGNSIKGFRNNS